MGLITVEGIKVFSLSRTLTRGSGFRRSHFIVNVWVTADTSVVEKTDNLNDTVDYVKIIEIVKHKWI